MASTTERAGDAAARSGVGVGVDARQPSACRHGGVEPRARASRCRPAPRARMRLTVRYLRPAWQLRLLQVQLRLQRRWLARLLWASQAFRFLCSASCHLVQAQSC